MKKFFTQIFSVAVFGRVMRAVIVLAQASRLQLMRVSVNGADQFESGVNLF